MFLSRRKKTTEPTLVRAQKVQLVDSEGRTRAILTTSEPTGIPWLSFYDADGTGRLVLGLRSDGTPFIVLSDRDGRALFKAPADTP